MTDTIPTVAVDQVVLVAAVKALWSDFDAEDGVDVTAVSATFLDALFADLMEVWDGGCDHSVGICKCDLALILGEVSMARNGLKTCPFCQGNQLVWNPTEEDEDREVTCPRCGGRGYVGRGE